MTPPVIVVNARHLDRMPAGYTLIYVGRSTSYRPEYGADFSVLGNPFTLASGYSRDEAVDAYADRARHDRRWWSGGRWTCSGSGRWMNGWRWCASVRRSAVTQM